MLATVQTTRNHNLLQDFALIVGAAAGIYTIYHLYHQMKITRIKLAELEALHPQLKA